MEDKQTKTYGKIAAALVAAQSEIPTIPKNASGYGYKYATLDDILSIVKPILHKNGLAITQLLTDEGITTMLLPTSGEYIESWAKLPPLAQGKNMNAAQAAGAAITYMRRYGISALLNLSDSEDTDGTVKQSSKPRGSVKEKSDDSKAPTSGSMGFEEAPAPQVEETGKNPPQKENAPTEQAKPEPKERKEAETIPDAKIVWDKSVRDSSGLCSQGQQNFIFSLATRAFGLDFTISEVADWTNVDAEAFVDTTAESFCGKLSKMDATRVVGSLKELVGME